jgi:hypothetical protein
LVGRVEEEEVEEREKEVRSIDRSKTNRFLAALSLSRFPLPIVISFASGKSTTIKADALRSASAAAAAERRREQPIEKAPEFEDRSTSFRFFSFSDLKKSE